MYKMVFGIDAVISTIFSFLKEYLNKVYQFTKDGVTYFKDYVTFMVASFPFDSPRKTLMLSLIFFILVVGLVVSFSSTSLKDGISGVDPYEVNLIYGEEGLSQGTGGEAGEGDNGEEEEEEGEDTPGTGALCVTDADCFSYVSEGYLRESLCCLPEVYEGFSCSGYCLAYGLDRDSCKHPGTCLFQTLKSFENHAKYTDNRCDVMIQDGNIIPRTRDRRDLFCMNNAGGTIGFNGDAICCDYSSYCEGYCSSKGGLGCLDLTKCPAEDDLTVSLIKGEDLNG